MKQLEFSTLRLFVAVAEAGSLSAAAEKGSIAIAAVSKRITDLEGGTGSQLFYRHARGMTLTPAGRELLVHAKQILFDVERMQSDLRHFSRGDKGHVRVAAVASAVTEFLPGELKRFADHHPNIVIDLEESTSLDVVDAVIEGRVDLGIFIGPTLNPDIVTFPYRDDELCIVAPPDHPLARASAVRFAELAPYDFICLNPSSSIGQLIAAAGGGGLRTRINVRGTDALCRMVAAGLGVGIAPSLVAQPHTRSMGVVRVALDEPWAQRQLLLGVRSEAGLSAAARTFLESCRDHERAHVPLTAAR